MKKYLGLFLVLAVLSVVGIKSTKAEEGGSINSGGGSVRSALSEQMKAQREAFKVKAEELKTQREAAREAFGVKKEEANKAIEVKREELKTQREAIETEIELKRKEVKGKLEALKGTFKNEKNQVKAKMLEQRIIVRQRTLGVFDNAIIRLETLKVRVSAQITKLEGKGVDTIAAESLVATAETKLNAAKEKVIEINALLAASINEISAENKAKLKILRDETQVLIKDARNALQDAIKSLWEAVKVEREAVKNSRTADTNEGENETESETTN